MARGYPDFSPGAARGREGEFLQTIAEPPVWYKDDFESPLFRWLVQVGSAYNLSEAGDGTNESRVYSGDGCMVIKSSGGVAGRVARTIGLPPIGYRVGCSLFINLWKTDDYSAVIGNNKIFKLEFYKSATLLTFSVAYVPTTGKWYLTEDVEATWVEVATHLLTSYSHHYLKLIIDPDTGYYDKLIIDEEVVDLSAYSVTAPESTVGTALGVYIQNFAAALKTVCFYIDEFTITYGEI